MRSAEKLFVYAVLLGGIGLVTALVVFMAGGLKDEAVSEAAVEKHVKGIDALNGEVRGEIAGETVEKPLKEAVEPGTEGVAQNPSRGAGTASATLVDALTGRLVSEFGDPLPGATIELRHDQFSSLLSAINDGDDETVLYGGEDNATCESGDDGRFRFEEVKISDHTKLLINHPDYVPKKVPVKASKGGNADLGDISLTLGGSVCGRVLNHLGAGLDIAKVRVCPRADRDRTGTVSVFSLSGRESQWESVTGPSGFFRITGLPEGKVDLFASHPEHLAGSLTDVDVVKGAEKSGMNIKLLMGETIAGRVVDAKDKPVGLARVRVDNVLHMDMDKMGSIPFGMMWPEPVKTDEDGFFEIKGLKKGNYTVRVNSNGFLPFKAANIETGTKEMLAVLRKGGSIFGVVKDARTKEPVEEFKSVVESGPFGGSGPDVFKGKEAAVKAPEDIGHSGAFYISGLPDGALNLLFKADGYADAGLTEVSVEPGQSRRMDVLLYPESVVAGKLVSYAGEPVEGGRVFLKKPEKQYSGGSDLRSTLRIERTGDFISMGGGDMWKKKVKSGKDGAFVFKGVPEGEYEITASHKEHTDSIPRPVSVKSEEMCEGIEVRLGESGSIEGVVYGVDGEPLAGGRVTAKNAESAGFSMESAKSEENGSYTLKGLDPGEYLVKLESGSEARSLGGMMMISVSGTLEDTAPGVHRVLVERGKVTVLDLYETLKGSIAGRVTEAGKPVEEMAMKLFDAGKFKFMPIKKVQTDVNGSYIFEDLEPGEYNVCTDMKGSGQPLEKDVALKEGATVYTDFSLPSGRITGMVTDAQTGKPLKGIKVSAEEYNDEDEKDQKKEKKSSTSMIGINMISTSQSDGGDGFVQSISFSGGGTPPVETDAEGRYEIRYVKNGEYTVKASGGEYSAGELCPVKVNEGCETSRQDLELQRGYSLAGAVIDSATGKPVPHVPVFCSEFDPKTGAKGENKICVSEEDGTFKLSGLKPGTFKLEMTSGGYKGEKQIEIKKKSIEGLKLDVTGTQ